MQSRYVLNDPPKTEIPCENVDFTICMEQSNIYGCLLRAGGSINEKHPLVIMLHGIPGHEKNLDLAQALRRTGVHVAYFSYRGCWGSQGEYAISHLVPDACVVLSYFYENAEQFGIDRSNIWLLGHSLGGFTALHTLAQSSIPLCGAILVAPCDLGMMYECEQDDFSILIDPKDSPGDCLNIAYAGVLRKETEENSHNWRFSAIAEKLKEYQLCFIGGSRDPVTPVKQHICPLLKELNNNTDYFELNDDHVFASSRIALAMICAQWLEKHI